jgi:murein DD-endopeptidase MepM/ murein hydrolase activator NlpD
VVRHRRRSRRKRFLGPLGIGVVAFAAIGLIVAGNGASPKPVGAVAGETDVPSHTAATVPGGDDPTASPSRSSPQPAPTRSPAPSPPPEGEPADAPSVPGLTGYRWPLANARLTLPFGPTPWGGWVVDGQKFHDGIDLATFCGDRIVAAHGGTVLSAGRRYDDHMGWIGDLSTYYARLDAKKLWGTLPIVVVIDDGNGYRSVYAHFAKTVVKKGQTVAAGTLLGYEGRTGRASGCHLHYGLFDPSGAGQFTMDPVAARHMKLPGAEVARIDPQLVLPSRTRPKPKASPSPAR